MSSGGPLAPTPGGPGRKPGKAAMTPSSPHKRLPHGFPGPGPGFSSSVQRATCCLGFFFCFILAQFQDGGCKSAKFAESLPQIARVLEGGHVRSPLPSCTGLLRGVVGCVSPEARTPPAPPCPAFRIGTVTERPLQPHPGSAGAPSCPREPGNVPDPGPPASS